MQQRPTYSASGASQWDWETLYKYFHGELSEEEMQRISAELEEDPLLADAVEGLQHIQDPKEVKRHVQQLRHLTKEHILTQQPLLRREATTKRKSRIRPETYPQTIMGIAAAILMIVIGVWTIRSVNQGSTAVSETDLITDATPMPSTEADKPKPAAPVPTIKEDASSLPAHSPTTIPKAERSPSPEIEQTIGTFPAEEAEREALMDPPIVTVEDEDAFADEGLEYVEEGQGSLPSSPNPSVPTSTAAVEKPGGSEDDVDFNPYRDKTRKREEIAREALDPTTAGAISSDFYDDIPVSDSVTVGAGESVSYLSEEVPVLKDSIYDGYYIVPDNKQLSDGKLSKARTISQIMVEGIGAYDQKRYADAENLFSEVILSEPDNLVARYYLGRTYQGMGLPKKAISQFRPILKFPEAQVYDPARFYLAKSYAETGRTRQAVRLWETLVGEAGEYAELSTQMLDLYRD